MKRISKQRMEDESRELIKTITGIEEDEENFEICESFTKSNLLYHKYLDPNERNINKSIQGIREKFLVHAQFEKADRFEDLIDKYKSSPFFDQQLDQHDLKYRLLSLLLNLSENPVNSDYIPTSPTPEPEIEKIDWLAILKEGEPEPQPLGSESELSDWSDLSTNEASAADRLKEVDEDKEDAANYSVLGSKFSSSAKDAEPRGWLKETLQFPYWWEEQPDPASSFASQTEARLQALGHLELQTEKITEYQLIREIIWMLRCPVDSPVFQFRSGRFEVTEGVTLTSLSEQATRQLCSEIIPTFQHIAAIKSFIHKVEAPVAGEVVPHTIEGYVAGLNLVLHQFSQCLLEVETDVSRQEQTYTILTLVSALRPWTNKISILRNLHDLAIKDYNDEDSSNCYRSMRVLSVVYNGLINCIYPTLTSCLMDIFLMAVRPYLTILEGWLIEGVLQDYREEFIFYRSQTGSTPADQNLWTDVFKARHYQQKLRMSNIRPVTLFVELADKILVAGKSNEILSKMEKLCSKAPQKSDSHSTIYQQFLHNIKSRLPRQLPSQSEDDVTSYKSYHQSQKASPKTNQSQLGCSKLDQSEEGGCSTFADIVASADDEFLATAFSSMFVEMEQERETPSYDGNRSTVLDLDIDPLIPLDSMMTDGLGVGILTHYTSSCSALVDLFIKDLEIEVQLSRARTVFFMEAGDLMQDFSSQIFSMIHRKESDLLDSSSLTLLLQDCLSQRFGSWIDQFSCSYDPSAGDSLQHISIHLQVPWPASIILSDESLRTYNKIFSFLIGVKRALWCLQSTSLKQIAEIDNQLRNQSLAEQSLGSSLTGGEKLHRLQLLRAWLLYFVTLLHGYFMSRVVHSTHLELADGISKASDLNQLIEVHQTYLGRIHDRCFLHPGAKMLKEAISMVMGVCLEVYSSIQENHVNSALLIEWEHKYARCHNFLSDTLNTMVKRSKLPHLEGLAAALIHSRPQVQDLP